MPVAGSIATFRIFSGVLCGDLLDLHAALGRGHHGDAGGGAVDQHAEIQLALDVAAFLDIEALDFLAGRTGLLGHEDVAEHLLGVRRTSSTDLTTRTPPLPSGLSAKRPAPRPPAWIWDLTTQTGPPSSLATCLGLGGGVGDAAARHRRHHILSAGFWPGIHGYSWTSVCLMAAIW